MSTLILYARHSDLRSGDTISITAGDEDTDYPKENVTDRKARTVGKFTGMSGTYRRTFSGAVEVVAAAFINTNATAIQLTNDQGLDEAITIPATPEDGIPIDPWIDIRDVANTTAAQWNAALTGPTGVYLGEFLLVATLRSLDGLWTPQPVERDAHPSVHHETDGGVDLDLGLGVRTREADLTVRDDEGRAALLSLQRDQLGRVRPWLLIPNSGLNDAWFVKLTSPAMALQTVGGSPSGLPKFVLDTNLMVREDQKGIA